MLTKYIKGFLLWICLDGLIISEWSFLCRKWDKASKKINKLTLYFISKVYRFYLWSGLYIHFNWINKETIKINESNNIEIKLIFH